MNMSNIQTDLNKEVTYERLLEYLNELVAVWGNEGVMDMLEGAIKELEKKANE